MKILHPGVADDPSVDHVVHGAKTVPSEPVGDVLASQYPTNPVLRFQRERSEQIYASTAREPLGATYKRGHVFPDGLGTINGFGTKSEVAPTSSMVKDMVFPPSEGELGSTIMLGDKQSSDAHKMYVTSHGNYAPGEQRTRGYDWNAAGVDLGTTRFGMSTKPGGVDEINKLFNDLNAPAMTVEQSINPLKDTTKRNQMTGVSIVDLKAETARITGFDPLGRSKPLGTGIKIDPDVTHGAPSRTRDERGELEWDAGRIVRGDYSVEEQQPDPRIGKVMSRQGYKFEASSVDDNRTFGVPSTRRDLLPPTMRSVADETAYGDEASAAALVNPGFGADRGVSEQDFQEMFGKQRLRRFYEDAGVMGAVDDDEGDDRFFNDVFDAAASEDAATGRVLADDQNPCTTLGTFQKTRVAMMAHAMQL